MGELQSLSKYHYKMLLVVTEVYRQQLWMYENKRHSIDDRIVSLTQPHIRPIVRGKAWKSVEEESKAVSELPQGLRIFRPGSPI